MYEREETDIEELIRKLRPRLMRMKLPYRAPARKKTRRKEMTEPKGAPTTAEMDAAALEAGKELQKLSPAAVAEVASWWRKWYLRTPEGKTGAGHKRLGRLLVNTGEISGR